MDKHYLAAMGMIVGTIMGAGILALPYAVSQSGFLIGLVLIVIVGIASVLITMYTGELSFASKKIHQLPILISRYTDRRFGVGVLLLQVLTLYGALIAYLIAMGVSLSLLVGLPYIVSVLLAFVLTSLLILRGYNTVENAEAPLSIAKIILIVAVSIPFILVANSHNLSTVHPSKALFSFGVVLFSLTAFTVVPEIKEELQNNREKFNSVVIVSMIVSIAVYVLFAAAFIGAFGSGVSAIATNSVTSGWFTYLFYLITIFIVITPYLALSLVLLDSFNLDFGIKRYPAFALATFIPLVLSLTGLNFEYVLDVIGGLLLPILSIMVLVAVRNERRMKGTNSYYRAPGGTAALLFTAAVMVVGLVYTLVYIV